MSHDPERAPRLLLTERDAVLPVLRDLSPTDFDRPTLLPGWTVGHVVAHCSAALSRAATGTVHGWSPQENDRDIADRAQWTVGELLDELETGYGGAAEAIRAAAGALDGLAVGEWLHGGDLRDALSLPDAYASAGIDDALVLLAERSALPRFAVPPATVRLPDREFTIGTGDPVATIDADAATFVRLCGGRSPDPARFTVTGAEPGAYVMFH